MCASRRGGGIECVSLELATGAFQNVAAPPRPAAPALDVSPDGARKLVVDQVANTVTVVDPRSNATLESLALTTPDARCVTDAFFVGETIYASARDCDKQLDFEAKHAFLYAGTTRTPIRPVMFGGNAIAPLPDGRWALGSLKPYRVDVIDPKAAGVRGTIMLPQLHGTMCCLALGMTAMGTLLAETSALAAAGNELVAVSSRAVALISLAPSLRVVKVFPFPDCGT